METRIALIGIIISDLTATEMVNALLHQYANSIIGRLGIPYKTKNVNIISVVIDDTQNAISNLAGKIGALKGVAVKTMYSAVNNE